VLPVPPQLQLSRHRRSPPRVVGHPSG